MPTIVNYAPSMYPMIRFVNLAPCFACIPHDTNRSNDVCNIAEMRHKMRATDMKHLIMYKNTNNSYCFLYRIRTANHLKVARTPVSSCAVFVHFPTCSLSDCSAMWYWLRYGWMSAVETATSRGLPRPTTLIIVLNACTCRRAQA